MESDLDDRLRTELHPELEVIRPLGKGNHALVYLARETSLQRLVALKVLRPELNDDEVMRRRFEREAQAAARIHHPNVTPIHRVGRLDGDIPYIVMAYIDGRTLEDTIEANGPFPVDRARSALGSIASALAAAHAQGIVHRDVRPGNVFIEKNTGRAILADFGIAGLTETGSETATRLTAAGVRLGDMNYMSPEQLQGEPAREQSDIYAFGILAYEMLTGAGPYQAGSVSQVVTAHLKQQPRPLAEALPMIDPATAALVERCLNKDPNRRPTATYVASQLSAAPSAPDESAAIAEHAGPVARFLFELRRRRVYQVAVGYVVLGYGMLEVTNTFEEALGLPGWADTAVAILVVACFPVAMVLSWIYDISARGISRTSDDPTAAGASIARSALPWIALAGSVALAAVLAWIMLRR